MKISPSLLAADFANLENEVREIENAGADCLHLDVMDGRFVPNLSFGFPVIEALREKTTLPFDVHLMIEEPERYIERFAAVGSDMITFHVEACRDVGAALDLIHRAGKRAGLSVKPVTPAESIFPYLDRCDLVLVMTVEPGYGGQKFLTETVGKVKALRKEIDARGLSVCLSADGGINPETAKILKDAGVDMLVAGSSVFRARDRRHAIATLKAACSAEF